MNTRRVLAVSVATFLALALMVPVVLAAGVSSAVDSFDTPTYSGGTGWTTNWTEIGDGPGSASSGVIQAVSTGCDGTSCLRFQSLLGVSATYHIWRRTNIDGANAATLSFSYTTNGVGTLSVATRSDPSDAWTEQTLSGSGNYTTHSMSIAPDASDATEVRFSLSSVLLIAASAHIDNVSITASYPTTSTTVASTTTTTEPLITLPTVTVPTILTTTTALAVPGSTTTTLAGSTTTTPTTTTNFAAPGPGGEGSDPGEEGPPDDSDPTVLPPLSEAEANLAAENNIAVDLAGGEDFATFGINPLTSLGVRLNSTVEAITTEVLSALVLGAMLAFFGIRRVSDDEEEPERHTS